MESKIQKHLIDYFSFFDEFETTAKTSLRDCQNYAASINRLIKRCKNIKQAELQETPLAKYEDLQIKLCTLLRNLISSHIQDIQSKQSTVEDLFEKLVNKNRSLHESCKGNNVEETSSLVKGSPTQPPLKQLLKYADDTITFAAHVTAQIESALNILTITKLQTKSFENHFCYPVQWNQRVTEIKLYTSFLTETQV